MKSCLIVEGSKVIRMVARKILQGLHFDTSEAADGGEALDACKAQLPDAVLLDWDMAVMDGLQFLIELRKLPGGETPVVVCCSTETDIKHIQKAIECGANEHLSLIHI